MDIHYLRLNVQKLKTHRAFIDDIEKRLNIDDQRHLQRGTELLDDVIVYMGEYLKGAETALGLRPFFSENQDNPLKEMTDL